MVLGSILAGLATPSEAGAVGALGALVLGATLGELDVQKIKKATAETTWITSMVILLLIGSSFFVAVFRGSGGHHLFESLFLGIPGGQLGFLIAMSLLIFLLGFVLDFFEIVFIVFPLVLPVAHVLGIDIAFLCIVVALNLQTSFLTPPFGFSLFYLKSVSPPEVTTQLIYRGIIPFVIIQIVVMSGYIAFQLLSS
jgi:tripartite ATP-independent transporter DctM subunit